MVATKKRKARRDPGRAQKSPDSVREPELDRAIGLLCKLNLIDLRSAIPVLERYARKTSGAEAAPSAPPECAADRATRRDVGFTAPGPPPDSFGPMYLNALAFTIHRQGDASPILDRLNGSSEVRCQDGSYLLTRFMNRFEEYEVGIADRALMRGRRITILCPKDYAVDLAVAFAQRVPSRTIAFYDNASGRIVFRHENEEDILLKAEEGYEPGDAR
ncbi:MAG: hypothetical protein Q7R41_18765 [Phycisphaerales bacterium]|nr:hypothetical protein [Phycisphaerales bacterium]